MTVTDGALMLRGEVRERTEKNETGYRRIERRYGTFQRTIPLPALIDAEQASAEYVNRGVGGALAQSRSGERKRSSTAG